MPSLIYFRKSLCYGLLSFLFPLFQCTPPCAKDPTRQDCSPLAVITPISKITREGSTSWVIQGLEPEIKIQPTVVLTVQNDKTFTTTAVQLSILSMTKEPDGSGMRLEVKINHPESFPTGGPATIRIYMGPKLLLSFDTFVYTPPKLDAEQSASIAPISYQASRSSTQLQMLPPKSNAVASSLFVTEQDEGTNQRILAKYDYDGANRLLLLDNTFKPPVATEMRNDFRGLFAISPGLSLAYEYRWQGPNPTGPYFTVFSFPPLVSEPSKHISDVAPANPYLVTIDPFTSRKLLMVSTNIHTFTIDEKTFQYKPLSTLTTPKRLRFLQAQHIELDRKPTKDSTDVYWLDAVGIDEMDQIYIYRWTGTELKVDEQLTQAANEAAQAGQEGLKKNVTAIAGFSLYDIDQDGYPDLVLALQDKNTGLTQEIGWVRYQKNGKFDTLNKSTRAQLAGSPLKGVFSMAVGDINSDGKPDVALTTGDKVQVYLNQSL